MQKESVSLPTLRDNQELYGTLLQEMLFEYVVSDTFCSLPAEERRERVGAYEEINLLVASVIRNRGKTGPEQTDAELASESAA